MIPIHKTTSNTRPLLKTTFLCPERWSHLTEATVVL